MTLTKLTPVGKGLLDSEPTHPARSLLARLHLTQLSMLLGAAASGTATIRVGSPVHDPSSTTQLWV